MGGQSRQRRPLRNFSGLFLLFSSLSHVSDYDDAIRLAFLIIGPQPANDFDEQHRQSKKDSMLVLLPAR